MRIPPLLSLTVFVGSLAFLAACAIPPAPTKLGPDPDISATRILQRTKVLSSDEFEGRAPGSPGEERTVAYLIREFTRLGLAPGNPNGTYQQDVPLVGITSTPTLSFDVGGTSLPMTPINDFVGPSSRLVPRIDVQGSDVVFVGYGIVAPEFGWDDFKGVDVKGKTVVMLINDPPVPDPKDPAQLDPKFFGGKAMTYYGRWTYKYEVAAAKGAAACLIVHETGPAAYPFAVVIGSRSRENFELRTPDLNASHVAMEGWLTLDAAKKLFSAAGQDFDTQKKNALAKDFKPVALGAKASFTIDNVLRDVASRNVVAKLEGRDPKQRAEYVIYSSHWDHLGRDPRLTGDQIFNGAYDNASGTAVLVELAQAYAALPPGERPRRSVLFLAVTAEEKGLLGARYYAANPLYPLVKTAANVNIDGAQVLGPSRDLEVIGYGNSTLDDLAAQILARSDRTLTPDTEPEKGYFYRSDHFEFAKQGVPAFYTSPGIDIIGRPAGYGREKKTEYTANIYHKVNDEIQPAWDFGGAASDGRFFFELGYEVADSTTWPTWKPGTEFKAKRDAMMRQR